MTQQEKVDVNRASAAELASVHGITAAAAEEIVRYRQRNGEIRSIEEVERLPAVRQAQLSDLRDRLTL